MHKCSIWIFFGETFKIEAGEGCAVSRYREEFAVICGIGQRKVGFVDGFLCCCGQDGEDVLRLFFVREGGEEAVDEQGSGVVTDSKEGI